MHGGLELEKRMLFERVEGSQVRGRLRPTQLLARRDVEDLPPEAPVAQERVHIVVSGEAPVAEFLPKKNGAIIPPSRVKRIGILDERGIAGIEGNLVLGGGHQGTLSATRLRGNAD